MASARRFLSLGSPLDLGRHLGEPDERLKERLTAASDVAIALDLSTLPHEEAARVLMLLPAERAMHVFERLSAAEAAFLLPLVPPALQHRLFRHLQRDEQADIVPLVDETTRERLLAKLPVNIRRELKVLLKYPEDHLASIMSVGVPTFAESLTVAEAVERLRTLANDSDATVHYLYVVDGLDHLVGVLSLRELLHVKGARTLGDACRRDVTIIRDFEDPEDAARHQQASGWRSLPVVDPDGRLVGVLTDEDASEYLALEETEDFQRFGGMQPLDQPYLRTGVGTFIRKRGGWLLVLFAAQLVTSYILELYEFALTEVVALSFFIPVLVATGGNVGSQSSSLIIRALAVGEVNFGSAVKVAIKESVTGIGVGVMMGALALGRVQAGGGPWALSLVVGGSIVLVCVMAAVFGGLLPLLVDRLGGDPAMMSAPLIATLVDAIGIILYLSLAVAVLGL